MKFSTSAQINLTAAGKLTLFAVAMFAFGYALVPLYYKICQITGINNLLNPQSAQGLSIDKNRILRLEFDVNSRGLVSMEPNMRLLTEAHPGKTYSVIYTLKNLSGRPLLAQAVPSYGPRRAGKWFRKIQCFCFSQLTMAIDEVRQSPVVFVVDSDLPPDINVIALSYTFFEIEGGKVPDEHGHGAEIQQNVDSDSVFHSHAAAEMPALPAYFPADSPVSLSADYSTVAVFARQIGNTINNFLRNFPPILSAPPAVAVRPALPAL